jgi:hypothetical protein
MTIQAALQVNQANLVKNLRFSFTNAATVLGELMQNARRAGASRVEIDFDEESRTLSVRDDGCGIGDFQPLLTVAESGWDAATVEREHPFGLGFLSALFACGHLMVQSTGGCIHAPTADILAFKPVLVQPVFSGLAAAARRRDGSGWCGRACGPRCFGLAPAEPRTGSPGSSPPAGPGR